MSDPSRGPPSNWGPHSSGGQMPPQPFPRGGPFPGQPGFNGQNNGYFPPGNGSGFPARPAPPRSPPQAVESVWSEHTNAQGTKYWYNKITKSSTWEKPDELKSPEELEADACSWKEYTNDQGRKYFYNQKTRESRWDMPDEYKAVLDKQEAKNRSQVTDPKDALRLLFIEKGMTAYWSWDQTNAACKDEERWKSMKMADRKQVYQQVVRELQRKEQDEKRLQEEKLANDFVAMLFDKEVDEFTTFREAMEACASDSRCKAIPSDRDRISLFERFQRDRSRRIDEARGKIRDENVRALRELIDQDPRVELRLQWRDFCAMYYEVSSFKALAKTDRLRVFRTRMKEFEDKINKDWSEKDAALKLQSRYAREGFRQLLQEHAQSGAINVRSKWKELLPLIERNDRYAAIVDADGSRPAELFYDFIEELEDKLDVDKKRAKDIMRDINLPMTLSMSYEAWCAVMKTHDGWKALDKANTRFLFEDLQEKTRKSQEKQRRREAVLFMSLLKDSADSLASYASYEEAEASLAPEYRKRFAAEFTDESAATVLTTADRAKVFELFKSDKPVSEFIFEATGGQVEQVSSDDESDDSNERRLSRLSRSHSDRHSSSHRSRDDDRRRDRNDRSSDRRRDRDRQSYRERRKRSRSGSRSPSRSRSPVGPRSPREQPASVAPPVTKKSKITETEVEEGELVE